MTANLPVNFKPIYGNGNYRGGKIRSYASLKRMKEEYGIKRIVNLAYDSMQGVYDENFQCGADEGDSKKGTQMPPNACEPLWAKELGMEFIMAPYWWLAKGWESPCQEVRDCPITDKEWLEVRAALVKGHTYVHCSQGVDRTSAISSRWALEADPNATRDGVIADAVSHKHGWASGVNQRSHFDKWILEGKPTPSLRRWVTYYKYQIPILFGGTVLGFAMLGTAWYVLSDD